MSTRTVVVTAISILFAASACFASPWTQGHLTKGDRLEESGPKGVIEAAIGCKWKNKEIMLEKVVFVLETGERRIFMRAALVQFKSVAEANEFLQDYFRSANFHPECKGKPGCQMMVSTIQFEGFAHLDVAESYLILPDDSKDYLREEELLLPVLSDDGGNGQKEK